MITLLTNDLRSTFVGFAREWLSVLSRGEYKHASEMIDSANAYGVRWGAMKFKPRYVMRVGVLR